MKQTLRKLTAMVLCLSLCLSMGIAAFAADETNTLGVTYSASLDRSEIETSAEDQTVVMAVKASKPVTVDGVGFTTVWDDALTLTGIRGGAEIGNYNQVATNLANGIAGWSSPDAENVENVTDLAVITFTVPANTPAGTYNVGVTKLELTKDYGEIWEDSASASAILTVTGTAVPPVPGEHKASISSDASSVKVGDTVKVDVNVTGEDFSAAEIEVAYSDDYREGEQDFWDSVVEAIKKAGENQTVKVSAKSYDRMPVKVAEALKGSGVTLAIDWNGGGDIVLDESSLPKVERNRVYYPLSLLEKMQSEAKANVGGEDTAANPSTSIFAHLTAMDGMAVDVTPANAGLESTNTVLILLLAIAAAALTGYAVYRSRKVD